ncbi:uncharacterized protein LOC132795967 [Drosophila nasuta]|uniref:Uncharacterized protein LOC117570838 n=1 Tax=Drosophila albomicans TaxID=7291 RepID=A0A6P8XB74_DROAB|nr:uncharacterized protein LOC117570838 [Drosophila albomicans]XP_060662933.1 uncharacterized protein LOC132795967 [Drosophila nasuta]
MNPARVRQPRIMHPHPDLQRVRNEERPHHDYDRFIPPLVAARLQLENPLDVARFVQNLRIILQRQRVHFDMGDGDGVHVWSLRTPPRSTDQDGGGDEMRQEQQHPHPLTVNAELRLLVQADDVLI